MGILARGDDLRRHQRDPEGHRGVASIEPAQGALMNPDELKLLDETLLGLAEAEQSGDLTSALDAFGWLDVLAAEPRAAIVLLFSAQGRTGRWSAALQDVLATDLTRLGVEGNANVVLPRPNSWVAGASEEGRGAALTGFLMGPRDVT